MNKMKNVEGRMPNYRNFLIEVGRNFKNNKRRSLYDVVRKHRVSGYIVPALLKRGYIIEKSKYGRIRIFESNFGPYSVDDLFVKRIMETASELGIEANKKAMEKAVNIGIAEIKNNEEARKMEDHPIISKHYPGESGAYLNDQTNGIAKHKIPSITEQALHAYSDNVLWNELKRRGYEGKIIRIKKEELR